MPKKKANPEKRGAKGHFSGSRLDFLNGYCDQYNSLRGKNRARFWLNFFDEWWKTYPWRLADNEEPPNDDAKMQALSEVGTEKALKKDVETKLKVRIGTWFTYRAALHNSRHKGGVWYKVLKRIQQQTDAKPRCRSVVQQFAHENPAEVDAAFAEAYEGKKLTPAQTMNGRYEVAKELFETTYSHLEGDFARRAKEANELELREWSLGLDEIGEAEDVQLARDNLFSAVHPLLRFIGRYSGCYVTLLASGVSTEEEGKPYFSTVHYFPEDGPRKKNWTEYDEDAFKDDVARPFVRYIHWMEGSNGEEEPMIEPEPTTGTLVPSRQLLSTAHPHRSTCASRQPAHAADRSKTSNKRRAMSARSSDEDVDMSMDGNSSSGSSVDPDEFPKKCPRTSTIVTRGSKTIASIRYAAVAASQDGCASSGAADDGVAIKSVNTNDVSEAAVVPAPNTPTPSHLSPQQMDVDPITPPTPVTSISDRTTPLHIKQADDVPSDADTEPTTPLHVQRADNVPSDMDTEPSSKPLDPRRPAKVPKFLKTGKYKIHNYLVDVDEPRFKNLLSKYIAFELADLSGIRGALPTDDRPNPVGWWSHRARPPKIPPYDSFSSFTSVIIKWWIGIQPDWRRLKRGKTSRVEGDFMCLYQPGINGLLNVVILVFWWASILKERSEPVGADYCWFVSDVTWVLSHLTSVAEGGFGA